MRLDLKNEDDIKKLLTRIKYSCCRLGRSEIAEETAQEVFTRMLEGKHQHATIDQAVIDYLREQYGRKGKPGYAERQALSKPDSYEQGDYDRTIQSGDGSNLDDRIDFNRITDNLTGFRRCLVIMRHRDGMNEKEIGHYFGFTESWAHLWLERIQTGISKRIGIKKSRIQGETCEKMETLLPEKTEGKRWRVEQGEIERLEKSQSWSMASLDETSF